MVITRVLGTAAAAAALAIGLAAVAAAQPTQSDPETDFLECVVEHQDTDGIGVCCVVYGGEYDDAGEACYIDFPVVSTPESRPTNPRVPLDTVPLEPVAIG